ncbi:TetR family transcriptional regulator [Fulvivirga ulvae]|uniref:TetR family transcriptional regulator n=1 Tax=Fulvivirga ulvae TaxID=2904245 RepID=UPI00351E4FFE
MATALKLSSTTGSRATSMAQTIESSGMLKDTFYHYFKTRKSSMTRPDLTLKIFPSQKQRQL